VTSPSVPGSSDTVPWLVFAAGALLIAVAWTFSLRARPRFSSGAGPIEPPEERALGA
jgi:hypothetical protein